MSSENAANAAQWDSGQRIAVLCAVDDDYKKIEMNGRDDLDCPVCKKPSVKYRKTGILEMTVWCTTCKTGIKQGNGAR